MPDSQNFDQDPYRLFFEELEASSASSSHDRQEPFKDSGLSQENVHKLTEDMFNPLPGESD